MRARCPHCDAETDVPAGAKAIVCKACYRAFTITDDVQTLTEAQSEQPTTGDEPTLTTRRLRLYCPECQREIDVPIGQSVVECPRCGKTFPAESPDDRPAHDVPLGTAKTHVTGRSTPTAPQEADRPGEAALEWMRSHFSGTYQILEFVGRGGMGAVYRAQQLRPKRNVAVKVMLGGAFASERHRRRFEREAQAVARLTHPAIVPVFDFGEVGGQPYFTMEFVHGRDLRTYAQAEDLNRGQICRMMVRVCDAVHHAHERGVIHRDLKPGNIMVDETGRPRILDFGLSRTSTEDGEPFGPLTVTGDFLGTPRYASPEQAFGHPQDVDRRTDVYALGVVLYELLVRMPPYPIDRQRGLKAFEILRDWEPVKPRDLYPGIPHDLEIIMLKAIEKDRERRYSTADEFGRDLESFLQDRPITARRATLGYRLSKWATRNRRVLIPVALSATIILVLSLAFMSRIGDALRQRDTARLLLEQRRQRYLGRSPTPAGRIQALMSSDSWDSAARHARDAPTLFPDEEGVEELEDVVREHAEDRVDQRLAGFADLLRRQDYEEARAEARRLSDLSVMLPAEPDFSGYTDLRDRLAQVEPTLVARAWQDLQAAVAESCTREDALARIDAYVEFAQRLPDDPNVEAAQTLRRQIEGEDPGYFLGQHVAAWERAVHGLNWEQAEAVLASARRTLAEGAPADAAQWQSRLVALSAALDRVVRPSTVRKVDWLRTLEKQQGPIGETGFVRSVVLVPGTDLLAAGARDGTVTLWHPETGRREEAELQCSAPLRPIAVSADGQLVAAGLDGGIVEVWSLPERKRLMQLNAHGANVRSVAFSPDGVLLASADFQSLALWNPASGERVDPGAIEGAEPVLFSPDGSLLTSTDADGQVCLWNVRRKRLSRRLSSADRLTALAFSPDGSVLATAFTRTDADTIALWDADSGDSLRRSLPVGSQVLGMTFSPDGSLLVAGCADNTVTVWDAAELRPLHTLTGHRGRVFDAVFTGDQRLLATCSADSSVRIWGLMVEEAEPAHP